MSVPAHTPHHTGLVVLTALAWLLSACSAAPPAAPPAAPGCGSDIPAERLVGRWLAKVEGETSPWALTLAPHPEHRGSLRGELSQGPLRHPVVADLDEGEFTMEESHDGQRIAATWLGQLVAPDCARDILGTRTASPSVVRPFRLTRQP